MAMSLITVREISASNNRPLQMLVKEDEMKLKCLDSIYLLDDGLYIRSHFIFYNYSDQMIRMFYNIHFITYIVNQ